jgi:hypothetical protein
MMLRSSGGQLSGGPNGVRAQSRAAIARPVSPPFANSEPGSGSPTVPLTR